MRLPEIAGHGVGGLRGLQEPAARNDKHADDGFMSAENFGPGLFTTGEC